MVFSERLGRHLRGNAVGYLALFVAFTGTAYAGSKITTKDIKKNAIVTKLIKNGEVLSADIDDETITGADVAANGLTGADIDESTLQGVNVLLADGSVTTLKLADAAVTLPKLADAAVDSAKIADGSIVDADVAAGAAIDDAKLGTINDAGKVADSALSSSVARLDAIQTFAAQHNFEAQTNVNLTDGEAFSIGSTLTGSITAFPMSIVLTNNTTSGVQSGLRLLNAGASTGVTESLLRIGNSDVGQALDTGIDFEASTQAIDTAIDASGAQIGTALHVGANDIETSGATISSTELEELDGDPTRSVSLPITAFINSTDSASINFGVSDGTAPDLALINGAPVIEYDDTATLAADGDTIATSFTVPIDYASGNLFVIRASKDGSTGAVAERMRCATSVNGAAVGGATTVTGFSQAISNLPMFPAGSYASGDSVALECNVDDGSLGGTTQDDVVRIHSVSFVYSATS